jgi:hypothetical protein
VINAGVHNIWSSLSKATTIHEGGYENSLPDRFIEIETRVRLRMLNHLNTISPVEKRPIRYDHRFDPPFGKSNTIVEY